MRPSSRVCQDNCRRRGRVSLPAEKVSLGDAKNYSALVSAANAGSLKRACAFGGMVCGLRQKLLVNGIRSGQNDVDRDEIVEGL